MLFRSNQSFFTIFIIASVAIAISTTFIVPVLNKIKRNKQEVLELFMHINKKNAEKELYKCRKFLSTLQGNQELEMIIEDTPEQKENTEENSEAEVKIDHNLGTSKRSYKKLKLDFELVIIEFLIFILLMEGYFILNYLLSRTFLNRIESLSDEFFLLISMYRKNYIIITMES